MDTDGGVDETDFFADPVAAAKAAMNGFDDDDDVVVDNNTDEIGGNYSFEPTGENDAGDDDNDINEDNEDVPMNGTNTNNDDDDDDDGDNNNNVTSTNDDTNDEFATTTNDGDNNDDDDDDDNDGVGTNSNTNNYAPAKVKVETDDYIGNTNDDEELAQDPTAADAIEEDGFGSTVINGRGIWHSWTRNFSTPLLALLDLLDNAFDAASLTHPGRIYIAPDIYKDPNVRGKPRTTGLTLWNNSIAPIKPLQKVLEVYTSLKGSHANSIGENGVGLKQGCATLSNLSFCVVKSHGNQYSLGVLAYQLQTDQGCSLPSFTFESTNLEELRDEMINKFKNEYPSVGDCIAKYGTMDGTQPSAADRLTALEIGVDRLIEKFKYMSTQGGWEKYSHIFGLIIDHLKHGEKANKAATGASAHGNAHTDQAIRVNKLLETLYQDLPKRYLHIPRTLDVRVGGQVVNFNYWQPRLVEMAQFDLKINRTANMIDVFTAKKAALNPDGDVDAEALAKIHIPPDDDYTLRVYTGFDSLRVCDDRAQKTAAMYIYSRQSGRLIKANMDCRGELGLTSGGTDFCQGLTLIVDDFNANFPLNPTKQDVAFGEQANGETHKRNLYIWLNAAIRLYYMFYKDRVCNKQKRILTESLRLIEPKVRQLIIQSSTSFQSLSDCQFTTFGEFTSLHLMNNGQSIRLLPFRTIEYFLGKDSRLQLPPVPEHELEIEKPGPKPRGSAAKKQKVGRPSAESRQYAAAAAAEYDDDFDAEYNDLTKGVDDDDDDYLVSSLSKKHLKQEQPQQSSGGRRKRFVSAKGVASSQVVETVSSGYKSNKRSRDSIESLDNDLHDIQFMTTRITALDEENKQLKKELKRNRKEQEAVLQKKDQQIEALKASRSELKTEASTLKQQVKALKQQVKDLMRSSSQPSIVSQLDDLSASRLGGGSVDAAKAAKRLKNLKSNLDVLKAENDDLKEQIKGLESTIIRKDKTIQAQRKLIDQRALEDDADSHGASDDDDSDSS